MKYFFTISCSLLFSLLYAQHVHNTGTLDSNFGINGKTLFTYNEGGVECFDATIQSNGKIICVGDGSRIFNGSERGIAVFSFLKTGIIDSSFGINGGTFIDVGYNGQRAHAVTVQDDDKILITGYGVNGTINLNYDIVTIRLNSNGSIDSSFGTNGIAIADYGNGDIARDIVLQPDGKLLVQGSSSGFFITLRYMQNGILDDNFGTDGKVITMFDGLATGFSITLQEDGKIIAAGTDDEKILLARYLSNGTPDISFGNNGEVRSNLTKNYDRANDILVLPDGKIIIAGSKSNIITDTALLARYNSDGSLDISFGNKGMIIPKMQYNSIITKIALQQDGKLITGGYSHVGGSAEQDFLLLRFNPDGSFDSSFANNGQQVTSLSIIDAAYGLALTKDNKIVLAGSSTNGIHNYVSLAQYHNDDLSKKQILIAKIRRWLQHHNGIVWDNMPGVKSYAVQRSADGVRWTTVHSQQSIVNSQTSVVNAQLSTVNYYNDASPLPANNYYRLQTTSVSGAVANSNIIAINNELSTINISPNPAKNVLRIEGLSSSSKTKITIVDLSGNVASSLQLKANSPSSYNLNISTLKPGNYLLRIETAENVITKQFVKE